MQISHWTGWLVYDSANRNQIDMFIIKLLLLCAAFTGIFFYRVSSYWKFIAYAYVSLIIFVILFSGGGTIENPASDGLITQFVRKATNDGYQMALFGLIVIIGYFGGLIFFERRVVKNIKAKNISIKKVSKIRGIIEFAVIAAFLVMSQIIILKVYFGRDKEQIEDIRSSTEEQVRLAGIEANKSLPQKLDDVTTLEKVTTDSRNTTYHYVISTNLDKEKIKKFVLPNIVKGQCGNADVKKLISEKNLSYTYLYKLADGNFFFEIKLNEELCKSYGY